MECQPDKNTGERIRIDGRLSRRGSKNGMSRTREHIDIRFQMIIAKSALIDGLLSFIYHLVVQRSEETYLLTRRLLRRAENLVSHGQLQDLDSSHRTYSIA